MHRLLPLLILLATGAFAQSQTVTLVDANGTPLTVTGGALATTGGGGGGGTVDQGTGGLSAWLVSGSGTFTVSGTVALSAGAATIGKVDQGAAGAAAWKVDGSAVTQPVSGTFWQATQPISAIALPLPTGAAQEHTAANSPHSVELTDGASFYTAAKTGQLPAALDGSGFLKVHEQGTATVSGTVAVSNAFALDATLTGGTAVAQVKSGAKGASTAALVTSTANGTDHQGLDVQLQNATLAVTQSGTWNIGTVTTVTTVSAVTSITNTVTIAGNLTNNNAAPGATHVGALTARANAAAPSWTEGNEALLSADLLGSLRSNLRSSTGVEVSVAQASTTSTQYGFLDQGAVTDAPPIYTTATTNPISLTPAGTVRVQQFESGMYSSTEQIRRSLEQLVVLQRATVLLLLQLKDPGRMDTADADALLGGPAK